MYNNVYNDTFLNARKLINNKEFKAAYEFLQTISDKCSEWYYLSGISAMNIGYYEQGEDYINRAKLMEPENEEYKDAVSKFSRYRDNYNYRAYNYNRRRHNDLDGCCCCCCDDCCEDCMKLWCLDSCCECFGGDLVSCF